MEQIENSGIFFYKDVSKQLYIMGDIHGDYQCLIHCMVDLCKVCSITQITNDEFETSNREILEWNNSCKSIIVFCGDFIHRKRFDDHVLDDECSDIYIIKTLLRLKESAQKFGGDIILISGNHEIMNILQPNESIYTSEKNLLTNTEYFSNNEFVNDYISKSYAWVKINDILIAHGGLCSDYLDYIDLSTKNLQGNSIIKFVNDKYHDFFTDFNFDKFKKDKEGYNLFVEYDMKNKSKHNMFWCREWGYDTVDCENYKRMLKLIDCSKMIIAHCPQFLSPEKPKMINFECKNLSTEETTFNLARVDLGMSRSFDYNKHDNFIYYLTNNYNRKMAVLKLLYSNGELIFNNSCIITEQLSCIQYLLLKYGLRLKDWKKKNISTNWIGFEYLEPILNLVLKTKEETEISDFLSNSVDKCVSSNKKILMTKTTQDSNTVIMCILYPLINLSIDSINSIVQFNNLVNTTKKKSLKITRK